MTEIQTFDFRGDPIQLVDIDGKPHIILRPAIETLGLSYVRQYRKLETKSWATVALAATVGADGKAREMVAVDVRTFLMLLATVDEHRVAEHIRPKLVDYQSEVADAIEAYWTKGQATNPRSVSGYEPLTFTWEELAAIIRQRHFINLSVVSLTRALRSCGVLRQNGSPRTKFAHLFWFSGTSWLINPKAVAFLAAQVYDTITRLEARGFVQIGLSEVDQAATQLSLDGAA